MKKHALLAAALVAAAMLTACDMEGRTLYREAKDFLASGAYEKALVLLEQIPDYRDADALLDECRAEVNRSKYDQAKAALSAGDYALAQELFSSIASYQDAERLASEAATLEGDGLAEAEALTIKGFSTEEDWDQGLDAAVLRLDAAEGSEKAALFADALRYLAAGSADRAIASIRSAEERGLAVLTQQEWEQALFSLIKANLGDEELSLKTAAVLYAVCPLDRAEAEPADLSAPSDGAADDGETGGGAEPALAVTDFDLLDKAGAAPAGKALVYVTRHNYLSEDQAYLDLARMRLLPQGLAAKSIDEAQYVIRIRYDYKHVQKFTTYYNWGVREYATIDILELPSQKQLGAPITVQAPAAASLKTAKMASEFVSGGPPDEGTVLEALNQAIDRLETLQSAQDNG